MRGEALKLQSPVEVAEMLRGRDDPMDGEQLSKFRDAALHLDESGVSQPAVRFHFQFHIVDQEPVVVASEFDGPAGPHAGILAQFTQRPHERLPQPLWILPGEFPVGGDVFARAILHTLFNKEHDGQPGELSHTDLSGYPVVGTRRSRGAGRVPSEKAQECSRIRDCIPHLVHGNSARGPLGVDRLEAHRLAELEDRLYHLCIGLVETPRHEEFV